jgi:hypothetical protein
MTTGFDLFFEWLIEEHKLLAPEFKQEYAKYAKYEWYYLADHERYEWIDIAHEVNRDDARQNGFLITANESIVPL